MHVQLGGDPWSDKKKIDTSFPTVLHWRDGCAAGGGRVQELHKARCSNGKHASSGQSQCVFSGAPQVNLGIFLPPFEPPFEPERASTFMSMEMEVLQFHSGLGAPLYPHEEVTNVLLEMEVWSSLVELLPPQPNFK